MKISETIENRTAKKANGVACCTPALPATKADDHRTTKIIGKRNCAIDVWFRYSRETQLVAVWSQDQIYFNH